MTNTPDTINVQVHYIAATKPFKIDVNPDTKLSSIKADALKAFDLTEDASKSFKMFYHKAELSDLDATIGSVAGDKHEVIIDLEEFITQG